jgi:hypothetical protein
MTAVGGLFALSSVPDLRRETLSSSAAIAQVAFFTTIRTIDSDPKSLPVVDLVVSREAR